MFSYKVDVGPPDNHSNTQYLWLRDEAINYETSEDDLAVLRNDYKFVVYKGQVHRVCQVEFDDDKRFIKFWITDPFRGFADYEQIEDIPTMPLSGAVASDIWDILKDAGAPEGGRSQFIIAQMTACVEYRFGGLLGFGGKFWNYRDKWYVTCYPEDDTPERTVLINGVNQKLSDLKASYANCD